MGIYDVLMLKGRNTRNSTYEELAKKLPENPPDVECGGGLHMKLGKIGAINASQTEPISLRCYTGNYKAGGYSAYN
jgi:hypothetical protein